MYAEEDYLQLSGIQHFAFCRRQWALIHVEQLWAENLLTAQGRLMHEKAHNPFFAEKRRDVIVARDMAVHSSKLGVSGKCDIVEFTKDDEKGVNLFGRSGKWVPQIVEYKRGRPRVKPSKSCKKCSLTDLCLSRAIEKYTVKKYIEESLQGEFKL